MERQTILERIGWQFIRIRGSEYYRNKTQTIENLIKSLNKLGIEPEQSLHQEQNSKKYDLLDRVKERANIIRQEWEEEQSQIATEKSNIIVNNHPEQLTFVPIAKENKKQFDSYDNRISNMILQMKEHYNKENYLESLVCANKIIKIDANNSIAVTFRDNAKRKLLNSSPSKKTYFMCHYIQSIVYHYVIFGHFTYSIPKISRSICLTISGVKPFLSAFCSGCRESVYCFTSGMFLRIFINE